MVAISTPHRQIDFPGKDQEEEFQFYFRQHWIRLWWPLRRLLLWTIFLGIAIYITVISFGTVDTAGTRRAILTVLCFGFLAANLSFLSAFYKYFLYVIIITDKKIHRIKKTLLTVDDHQSIDLWTLEDISKSQHGLVQNILGFGTLNLVMQTQDSLRIHFTPHISVKHEIIMGLREKARNRMVPQRMTQQVASKAEDGELQKE